MEEDKDLQWNRIQKAKEKNIGSWLKRKNKDNLGPTKAQNSRWRLSMTHRKKRKKHGNWLYIKKKVFLHYIFTEKSVANYTALTVGTIMD